MTREAEGSAMTPSSGGYWGTVLTRPVLSWSLYDLANTIFSMNIVSFYLSLWVIDMGGTDATWGYANSLTMALVFVSAPILGALSDQAGRRLPFLLMCTMGCVVCTAALGLGGLWITLGVFVIANYLFQAGLIFYDTTLSIVSTKRTRGVIGGFGIGVGYFGSFLGIATGLLLLDRIGHIGIFRVTALIFAIFAVPISKVEPPEELMKDIEGLYRYKCVRVEGMTIFCFRDRETAFHLITRSREEEEMRERLIFLRP